jgi:transcription antitermination factor NusG
MVPNQLVLDSPILSPEDARASKAQWYALYTRSRHEKLVERELNKKGIETFLPLRKITRDWSDRKKVIEDPLFKSYLFVRTALENRFPILTTVGVVNFVGFGPREPVAIPERELLIIQKFIQEEIPMDPFPYLKAGERVYIRSGPFKGVEGFIIRKDRHCRLVISLDLLMQSISIEIDQACVEPV